MNWIQYNVFFYFIATYLQPLLVKYQTDNPMVPFLFDNLFSTIKNLMELFIKQDILSTLIHGNQLKNFDFTKQDNLLPLKSITIGFAAEKVINDLKRKDILFSKEIKKILKFYRSILICFLEKVFERSLSSSAFLQATSCVKPSSILSSSKIKLLQQMKNLLHTLLSSSYIYH